MFSFFIKVMVGRHRSSEGRICEPGSNEVTNSRNLSPLTSHLPPLSLPSMRFSDRNHCTQNRVPGLLLQHHLIWEHAAIPTDMLESLGQFSLIVAKPISGIPGNVQFPIRIIGKTMLSSLVMRAAAFDGGIVLGNMKSIVHGRRAFVIVFKASCTFPKSFQSKPSGSMASSGALQPIV